MKERANRRFLLVQMTAWLNGTPKEGGVYQNFRLRCTTPYFHYLSHSAVVIPFESARPLPTREKGGDESAPPKSGGACDLG